MKNKKIYLLLVLILTIIILSLFIITKFLRDSDCSGLENEIKQILESYNHCETKSDCISINILSCPFGCYSFVNIDENISMIKNKIDSYQNSRCTKCVYGCIAPPNNSEISCQNNICIDTRIN